MKEFLKNRRAQCAKLAKQMNFWWPNRNEDLMG